GSDRSTILRPGDGIMNSSLNWEAMPESELGERLHNGDVDVLGELYRRFAPSLFDHFACTSRDKARAEDIVHDTFVRAWGERAKLNEPYDVKNWLFQMAVNLLGHERE